MSDTKAHHELLENFKKLKIAVIGDFILDIYIKGTVSRLSPEAPVPILEKESVTRSAGGAGNVWMNLFNLGVDAYLFTTGDPKIHDLHRDYCFIHPGKTPIKTRVMSGDHHLLRIDEEESCPEYTHYDELHWREDFEKLLPLLDGVVFSDYHKGSIDRTTSHAIISLCNEKGIPVFVDAKRHFDKYNHTLCVKCNSAEARGQNIEILRAQLNISHFVVTQGAMGLSVYYAGGGEGFGGREVGVVDVCGAGDTVIAVTAAAFCAGMNMLPALELANKAAAEVCKHPGVYAIKPEDLW